jgi:hypothetical protein
MPRRVVQLEHLPFRNLLTKAGRRPETKANSQKQRQESNHTRKREQDVFKLVGEHSTLSSAMRRHVTTPRFSCDLISVGVPV